MEKNIEKLDGKSKDVWSERLERLQQEFPEVLSETQVDCEQLKKLVGDENITEGERYQFSWAGKSSAFQEIKKGTTATLKPDKEESVNFDKTENLFIEGENLQILKILQKAYYGKVKMIYIDPPYNTGNDFIYNDQFAESREEYEEKTGDVGEEGKKLRAFRRNTKESGHCHSNWLSMMYPRLYLARNLLREDGVIFVSIDDNEVHNLRMIMNEIFGEENFGGVIINKSNPRGSQEPFGISTQHEYILCYTKTDQGLLSIVGYNRSKDDDEFSFITEDARRSRLLGLRKRGGDWRRSDRPNMFYPFYVDPKTKKVSLEKTKKYTVKVLPIKPNGEDGRWTWAKGTAEERISNLIGKEITRGGSSTFDIYRLDYLEDEEGNRKKEKLQSVWTDKELNYQYARQYFKDFFGSSEIFDFPKPPFLILKLMSALNDKSGIILDFFAGSGTTAHAVMDLNAEDCGNRKFIMVQLPEEIDEKSEARKAGYENIAEIAKERIRRAGKKVKQDCKDKEKIQKLDTGFKAFKLSSSNFKIWRREEVEKKEKLQQKLEDIVENVKQGARKENMLFELMLKLGISPNAKVEDKNGYYNIKGGEYVICLADEIDKDLVEDILSEEPRVFVCLDSAFGDNDELKTNTALQMKSKDIEFKVV